MIISRLSLDAYNKEEDLKVKARTYRRHHGRYPTEVCAHQIYRTDADRAIYLHQGFRKSGPMPGRQNYVAELLDEENR